MDRNTLISQNAVINAVTDEAVSDPIKIENYQDVVIEVIATGGSVDFKVSLLISTEDDAEDLDFSAAVSSTNRYETCSMVDSDGNIVSAGELIDTAGVRYFRLNWSQAARFMGVKLTDGAGSFAGTVTVNVLGSVK